jgi:acyl-coenzyme A thioesterase PaaI-like protein
VQQKDSHALQRMVLWESFESRDWKMADNPFTGARCFELRIWMDKETNDVEGLILLGKIEDTEGPPGHVHGGLLATIGDIVTAYAATGSFMMTFSLEIAYRSPVPLLSVLRFHGGRRRGDNIRSDAILCVVDFFDNRDKLKFSARGVFARPKLARL